MPDITISLTVRTCYEGHVWANPAFGRQPPCPYCLDAERREKNTYGDTLEARVRSLKGQVTRLRRKLGNAPGEEKSHG